MLRKVKGKLLRIDNKPWSHERVFFSLQNRTFTTENTYLRQTIDTRTKEDGSFFVELFTNSEGEIPSKYTCTLPDGDTFDFVLPVGTADLSISVLQELDLPPSSPSYKAIIEYVDEQLNASGISPSVLKIPFSFGDASPKVIAQNFTGKILSASVFIDTIFNGIVQLKLGDSTNNESLIPSIDIDPYTRGEYESFPLKIYNTASQIILSITIDSGVTQGNGFVILGI